MTKANLAKQPADVAAMFDEVAPQYDFSNSLLSLGQDRFWRKAVARTVNSQSGQSILDLAAGTGASSMAFLKPGVRVVAADFSQGMLAEGRKRHPELDFQFADATKMGFASNEFDTVTISFGLRNVVDVPAALSEMLRVTKPGGRLVICEFSRVSNPFFKPFYRLYLNWLLPLISKLSSQNPEAYEYLSESINAWPAQVELAKKVELAGWQQVGFKNLTFGIVAIHTATKAAK